MGNWHCRGHCADHRLAGYMSLGSMRWEMQREIGSEGRDDCVVLARRFVPMTASDRDKRPANSCESESRRESLHRSIM